jgi:RNA polymerase sigma-70 factor, ECF subfamily
VAVFRAPSLPTALAEARPQAHAGMAADEADDRAALAELYARHASPIHRFLRDLLGDHALAADATQETFCRAHRRLGALDDRTRAAPWLFTIARNVSLEFRRARTRYGRVFVSDASGPSGEDMREACDAMSRMGSPESVLLDQESLRVVATALGRLGEDRRAALLLRFDHGLAYEEIAEAMSWTLAKVKIEIFRAREVLRATLEEYRGGAR